MNGVRGLKFLLYSGISMIINRSCRVERSGRDQWNAMCAGVKKYLNNRGWGKKEEIGEIKYLFVFRISSLGYWGGYVEYKLVSSRIFQLRQLLS